MRSFVITCFLASPAAAAPVIYSVSPSSGPTAGNVPITIIGASLDGATASVGGQSCEVIDVTSDTLHCTLPEGQGLANEVTLLGDTGEASNIARFNYDAPYIDDISPAVGPTSGVPLTIQGDNFGLVRTVQVGQELCLIDEPASSHHEIICEVPPGVGKGHVVQVSVGAQLSNTVTFDYAAPSLTDVSPAQGPTEGGTLITITGSGFGVAGAGTTAFVGHRECPVSQPQADDSLVCTVPAGDGQALPVWVSVAGQVSPPTAAAAFSYSAPSILDVDPTTGPVAGNVIITIEGSSFGSTAKVTVGGQDCPVENRTASLLECTLPPGAGSLLEVRVSRDAMVSNALAFTYDFPEITGIEPAAGPTRGGVRLTISGNNFAPGKASVRVGQSACGVLSVSDGELVCALPEGSGVGRTVRLTQAGQASNGVAFDYLEPALSLISPDKGPTSGQIITIVGDNFGAQSATVSFGSDSCAVQSQDHDRIVCEVPPGVGKGHTLSVTLDGQSSEPSSFSYDAPVITEVYPAFGARSGGTPITIEGSSFGATGAAVSLGGADCPVGSQTHTQIVCELPPGEGRGVPLTVAVGGQSSSVAPYDYESDGPSATASLVETDEDTPLVVTLSGSDPEDQALSFAIAVAPPASEGTASLEGDRVLFVPAPDFSGETQLEFTVNDGETTSENAVVSITVVPVNDPPVLATVLAAALEDSPADITLAASDADGDELSFALVGAPSAGAVTLEGAVAHFTPPADFTGTATFRVSATDPSLASATASVIVQVTGVADAPFSAAVAVTTAEDQPIKLVLAGGDVDGDGLSFTLEAQPTHGGAVLQDGAVTYTPVADYFGADGFSFAASDGALNSTNAEVSVTVTPVNDAPELAAVALSAKSGGSAEAELAASDADGDALSFALGEPPPASSGTASVVGSVVRFTAASGFSGTAAFTVSASDGSTSSTAPVSVAVAAAPSGGSSGGGGGCAAVGEGVSVALLLLAWRRRRAV